MEQEKPLAKPSQEKRLWLLQGFDTKHELSISEKDAQLSQVLVTHMSQHATDPKTIEFTWRPERPFFIAGDTLNSLVEWLQHHRGVAPPTPLKPLISTDLGEHGLQSWDVEFAKRLWVSKDIYLVLIAAYHLRIQALCEILTAQIAAAIKGQPVEKINEILGL